MKVKIYREKLMRILDNELISITQLAKLSGTSQPWISNIASKSRNYKASPGFACRILSTLNLRKLKISNSGKDYEFEDIFYFIDKKKELNNE